MAKQNKPPFEIDEQVKCLDGQFSFNKEMFSTKKEFNDLNKPRYNVLYHVREVRKHKNGWSILLKEIVNKPTKFNHIDDKPVKPFLQEISFNATRFISIKKPKQTVNKDGNTAKAAKNNKK